MNCSPMTLGTVQLGMNYGIANEAGKPSQEKSFSILRTALEGGITTLDTARAYGDSEQVIGNFLKTWHGPTPTIITKIPKLQGSTPKELVRFAVQALEASLENLGVSKVDAVMLHGSSDPAIHGQACADAVKALIDLGYTDQVGVSVYNAQELQQMQKYDIFSLTQVPASIFDQRLINDGSLENLSQKNIQVFVRSVFLQGLFFLDPDKITDPILLTHAAPKIRSLLEIAQAEGLSVAQLAIAFIRNCVGVSSLVLGADSPEQVQANLSFFDTPTPDKRLMCRLREEFSNINIPKLMETLSKPKKQV